MSTIHLVIAEIGMWDGYTEKILRAFSSLEAAQKYKLRLYALLEKALAYYGSPEYYNDDMDDEPQTEEQRIFYAKRFLRHQMVIEIGDFIIKDIPLD